MAASGKGQVAINGLSAPIATVEIKAFREGALIPKKATESAAGYDLCAWMKDSYDEQTLIAPHSTMIVPTGLNVNIPNGYEVQIRPRSGLAAKFAVTVLNTPGTIDSDYCGDGEDFELKVILINHNKIPFTIKHGDRIAQMVVAKLAENELVVVEEFSTTDKTSRKGGLGSTGVSDKGGFDGS
jgi:dUTP pyrophosphatase